MTTPDRLLPGTHLTVDGEIVGNLGRDAVIARLGDNSRVLVVPLDDTAVRTVVPAAGGVPLPTSVYNLCTRVAREALAEAHDRHEHTDAGDTSTRRAITFGHGLVYALGILTDVDPDRADAVAADLAETWAGGWTELEPVLAEFLRGLGEADG